MDALTTPSNWQRVKLGDMTTSFTKQTGFDYSASIKPTLIKEQLPNYIPFIQNKDFLGHYINYKQIILFLMKLQLGFHKFY
ncbi:hypothetical protein HpKG66_01910 [Helicobacter pylori]